MTVAVNKCNITGYVLHELGKLREGVYCTDKTEIYDNYIDFLVCEGLERFTCFSDKCFNPTIEVNCTLSVAKITLDVAENMLTCHVLDEDLNSTETTEVFYEWIFDEETFILVSGKYDSELVLMLQPGKTFEAIISPIQLNITDSGDCTFTKVCYITPTGTVCEEDYVLCPNTIGLVVRNKVIYCPVPLGLIVTKKV